MKKTIAWGLLWAGLLPAISCSHKPDVIRIVPPASEFAMLIAGDSSPFKDRVKDKIIEKYREISEIHVIKIRDLNRIDADPFAVVVILDTCLAWSGFNRSLKSFLDNGRNRRKTVVSMTAGDPDWQYRYKDVDAVTAASLPENLDRFFFEIDAGIQNIIYPLN